MMPEEQPVKFKTWVSDIRTLLAIIVSIASVIAAVMINWTTYGASLQGIDTRLILIERALNIDGMPVNIRTMKSEQDKTTQDVMEMKETILKMQNDILNVKESQSEILRILRTEFKIK